MLILILLFISFSTCEAGLWKEQLNFDFEGKHFSYINRFHRGLSEAAQRDTEVISTNCYVMGHTQGLECDDVGNVFFTNRSLHYGRDKLRAPTNSENIAYASLQVIFSDFSAHFIHITDTIGGRTQRSVRKFSSRDSVFSGESRRRLLSKKGATLSSKPSSFDSGDLEIYHPVAHSEDNVYYSLNKNYNKYLDKVGS